MIIDDLMHTLLFDQPGGIDDGVDSSDLVNMDDSVIPDNTQDGSHHHSCPTAGDPIADEQWWNLQQADDTCAIVAQQGVLESLTGHVISQDELVRVALDNGWYRPHEGTTMECVGNVLEYYGVPVEHRSGCTLADLYDALESGHKVIVGLDADEVWTPEHDANGVPLKIPGGANHAVWITGIGTDPTGKLAVIANDSGTPDGRAEFIPVDDFLNAWEDSSNYAVITEVSTTSVA